MIPYQLQRTLEEDIHAAPPGQTRYLMTLIDMAMLSEAQRAKVHRDMAGQLHPLLQHPDYLALQPLGAMLAGPDNSSHAALDRLLSVAGVYDADLVQAWITSVLSPADLAAHLNHVSFAQGDNSDRYLLRYYDPLITPVLYRNADRAWVDSVFAPVVSWWFLGADLKQPQWHCIPGGAQAPPLPPGPLALTDTLWSALTRDPFPHRLLHELEQASPDIFSSTCRGVRLAQIRAHLASAKQMGLSRHDDLVAFVVMSLSRPPASLHTDPAWQTALRRAASGEAPLAASAPASVLRNQAAS
ncbi:DUF4123 domain-containing protein [Achromobacter kerstersii]|uniref:DUF4123 domain-containing protein n=1 Tax=Achromobacter kerstersii TaxID=1353890 RepID=UPI003D073674